MLTEHRHVLGEHSLHYVSGPVAGPPLLFLHGVLRCWQDFMPLIPSLSCRWQLLGLDFRGHGRSSRRAQRYRVLDYAEDATRMLEHVCPAPAVIYGHSLGAMVALAAAAGTARDRVRALVLEDPPFETMGRRISSTVFLSQFAGMQPLAGSTRTTSEIARALAEIRLSTPGSERSIRLGDLRDAAALRFAAHCLKQVDPEIFAPILEGTWLQRYHLESLLGRIRCPVLVLQADPASGGMLRDEDVDTLLSLLPDGTHLRLAGVGHLAHWSHPDWILRSIVPFLESIPDA